MKEYSLKEGDIHFIGIYYQNELLTITTRMGVIEEIFPNISQEIKNKQIKDFNKFTTQEQEWCYPKIIFTLSYINCGNRYVINHRELQWITLAIIRMLQPKYIHKGRDIPYNFKNDLPKIKHDSKFEATVGEWLDNHGIEYEIDYSFPDLMGDYKPLRFDYKLKNKNILIETQGEQHYEYCPHWHQSRWHFHKQIDYDTRKRAYCAKHKYWLIEIPYSCENLDRYLLPILIEDELLTDN